MESLNIHGYSQRPMSAGDPLVCQVCALTIGHVLMNEAPEARAERLKSIEFNHKPECKARLDTQRASRFGTATRRI